MTWIVARGVHDRPGKKDASRVFIPESELCVQALVTAGFVVAPLVDLVGRPEPLWEALEDAEDSLEGLVYVGHGLPLGLPTAGLVGLRGARELARWVAKAAYARIIPQDPIRDLPRGKGPRVALLSCSAADNPKKKGQQLDGPGTDGGFADGLRDELCRLGCPWNIVLAHATSGHAGKNPFLAAFEGRGSAAGGQGGSAVVRAKGPLWRTWKRLMADPSKEPSLRHRVPMLDPEEILVELHRGSGVIG